MRENKSMVVSFSGIDGAGKSTQIDALCRFLDGCGLRWKLYTLWDDIACFSRLRERCSIRFFKGDAGAGSPERPIERRDKNVTSWPVVLFRLFVYTADAVRLHMVLRPNSDHIPDVVIFDRYIYDEWANLPTAHRALRAYLKVISCAVPKPDVAFLLDADPFAAHERKPEYPLEFVRRNREAYLGVARFADMTVIPAGLAKETTELITKAISARFNNHEKLSISSPHCRGTADTKGTQASQRPFFSTTSSR